MTKILIATLALLVIVSSTLVLWIDPGHIRLFMSTNNSITIARISLMILLLLYAVVARARFNFYRYSLLITGLVLLSFGISSFVTPGHPSFYVLPLDGFMAFYGGLVATLTALEFNDVQPLSFASKVSSLLSSDKDIALSNKN